MVPLTEYCTHKTDRSCPTGGQEEATALSTNNRTLSRVNLASDWQGSRHVPPPCEKKNNEVSGKGKVDWSCRAGCQSNSRPHHRESDHAGLFG